MCILYTHACNEHCVHITSTCMLMTTTFYIHVPTCVLIAATGNSDFSKKHKNLHSANNHLIRSGER